MGLALKIKFSQQVGDCVCFILLSSWGGESKETLASIEQLTLHLNNRRPHADSKRKKKLQFYIKK